MKRSRNRQSVGTIALVVFALVAFVAHSIQAQELKIDTRPLTAQESADNGNIQKANGTQVVGLGQPVYLDLLVEAGTVVTQVVWTLNDVVNIDGISIPSSATIDDSPLPASLPTYDSIDRVNFDIADRKIIVPDVKASYLISAQAFTTNGVLEAELEVVGSVFIGADLGCLICHVDKETGFQGTLHYVAYKEAITGVSTDHFQERCIACHVTGYDDAPAAVNGGWDDVAADVGYVFPTNFVESNWTDMNPLLQNKSAIGCEVCHGPGQNHQRSLAMPNMADLIGISMSAGTCGQCHDKPGHHVKNFEWGNSLHGQTTVDRTGSCRDCHTAAGFVDANDPSDPNLLDGTIKPVRATFKEGITCAACHDPHAAGGQIHQLRDIQSVEFGNGEVITEGGAGLVCMSCHKGRRDAIPYVEDKKEDGSYQNGATGHFGPHHGPQGDMLAGVNAIEYGRDMPSSKHLTVVEESCATCHMQEVPDGLPDDAAGKVGGHSFMLAFNSTNGPIHLVEACSSCHGEIEDFDFGGEDYNLNGLVEGVQSEIKSLWYELGTLLPPVGSTNVVQSNSSFNTDQLRRALFNWEFIVEDGSWGVHNPKYAAAILRSSIDDLKGGIDIDKDGLVDSWEIEHFGDLTSQSGSDDYDGDGLTNAQEQNLGTWPTLVDTDGDGISDLVEVQAGSDPLDINSVPTSDMLIMDAVEVGYLPKATGTVVQFKVNDTLTGGGWQDLGPAQTNTGAWVFQLDSLRGSDSNTFYRATETE